MSQFACVSLVIRTSSFPLYKLPSSTHTLVATRLRVITLLLYCACIILHLTSDLSLLTTSMLHQGIAPLGGRGAKNPWTLVAFEKNFRALRNRTDGLWPTAGIRSFSPGVVALRDAGCGGWSGVMGSTFCCTVLLASRFSRLGEASNLIVPLPSTSSSVEESTVRWNWVDWRSAGCGGWSGVMGSTLCCTVSLASRFP